MDIPETIDCIDCGGVCHLLTHPHEDGGFDAEDVVVYRCEDCLDAWHLIVDEDGIA
ncbi:MAG TPA: hypothetical protein VFN21_10640 [Acidimicrobiales bacterium]|nr:hypothetical protein [Acidimicrobiales bacterium]